MSGSGWVIPGFFSDIHFDVQVGDNHRRSQSIANHGLQRFSLSFNRTAVTYESAADWYHIDQGMTGKWTNEGEVDEDDRAIAYINLDIDVYDNGVSGTIYSTMFPTGTPIKDLLIQGNKEGDILKMEAYDFIDGKPVFFAKLAARKYKDINGGERLQLAINDTVGWFPKTATLWRDTVPETPIITKPDEKKTEKRRPARELHYQGK